MKIYSSHMIAAILTSGLGLAQTHPAKGSGAAGAEKAGTAAPSPTAGVELKKGKEFAEAKLESKSGSKASGTVTFTKEATGIKVVANVTGVAAGLHGFHIHEKGDCSAADAASSGGHFNPAGAVHAGPTADVRHVGDLGNIEIKKDGSGTLMIVVKDPKGFAAWADIVGKAVILHEKADDLKTQPTGDAGKRFACGVIKLHA